ncbi:hypothetical protein C3747_99g143 [Trypanosoma cruzi]|uniref:DUF4833 domain-containing protein n=2 Tax=Trypanosoma cruzi TaxID=5693 RepID=A0A2V2WJ34_TRYCR|nr:hypothetical protein C3747_99g143 [Trypanosoma cruzi]RNC55639.1 hypothetical protein TcCL_ESM06869 [Trypanosoma cruzi]
MGNPKDASFLVHTLYEQCKGDATSLNRLLRQRVSPRGNRFERDTPDTFLYIERSKNRNIVAYAARLLDAVTQKSVSSGAGRSCIMDHSNPVHAYFIVLESAKFKENQENVVMSEIKELNFIERRLAYGCSAKPICRTMSDSMKEGIGPWLKQFDTHALTYVALPGHPLLLLLLPPLGGGTENGAEAEGTGQTNSGGGNEQEATDTLAVLLGFVGGVLSVLQRVYVCSVEPKHFYQLPTVKYIEFFGVSLESGSDTYEKRAN